MAVRTITAELSPAMRQGLALGHAAQPVVARALVARLLASPGSRRSPLDLTPLGRQLGKILRDLRRLHEAVEAIDRLLDSPEVRALAQRCPELDRARNVALRALACSRRWS